MLVPGSLAKSSCSQGANAVSLGIVKVKMMGCAGMARCAGLARGGEDSVASSVERGRSKPFAMAAMVASVGFPALLNARRTVALGNPKDLAKTSMLGNPASARAAQACLAKISAGVNEARAFPDCIGLTRLDGMAQE